MNIQALQRSLAVKARHQPDYRFDVLYKHVSHLDWLNQAMDRVLDNAGARTAGVDGMTNNDLRTERRREELISQLQHDLRSRRYRPEPVRRVYIAKSGRAEQRPLGIPTIADRIVQEALRMIMEPIWESRFLPCSHGFRPGHRTMDCLTLCRRFIQRSVKYYWVIEGDIRKCFDRVQHAVLLSLIQQVIDDHHILELCEAMLEAGVMEDGLVSPTAEGVPQGGIISPLWTNIYLHELDQWHWDRYTGLPKLGVGNKDWRRRHGLGNALMTRYADDFIVLSNATHQQTRHMRDELAAFLHERLALELHTEKTRVTHCTEGFDFLGIHSQYRRRRDNPDMWWLQMTPTRRNLQRVKDKIRWLTGQHGEFTPDRELFQAANAIVRGWAYYYQHINAARTFAQLDWWVNDRMVRRLAKRQEVSRKHIIARYKRRQTVNAQGRPCNRWNLQAEDVWLFKATDVKIRRYLPTAAQWSTNPYETAENDVETLKNLDESSYEKIRLVSMTSDAGKKATVRRQVLERDDFTCQECGSRANLEVHHRKGVRAGGKHSLTNMVTLCKQCHLQRTQIQNNSARQTA